MSAAALYRHSGKVGFTGLVAGAAATFLLGPILAAIYAVAIAYIPFIYLNLILTGLFGAATGFGIAFAMKKGKVRNTWVIVGGAFLGTCFVHYVGWMFWMAMLAFRSDIPVPFFEILFPPTFLMMVWEVSEVGAWTLGSSDSPVTGFFLWAVWILEALIVFGASLVVAFFVADSEPFCESCESWCEARDDVLRFSGRVSGGAIQARLLEGDLNVLAETPRAGPRDNPWHQVDLCLCPSCGATNTLTFSECSVTYDKKGNAQVNKAPLVTRMLLDDEQAAWVQGLRDAPPAQPSGWQPPTPSPG